ncbi:MAG TPA: hypothetical protein VE046_00965 [Steroidobacteraceae bacterium]|nr:hypothetical protein [Steroidobacteraceae bacterium]
MADYDQLCREKRHAMPLSGVIVAVSESLRKFPPRFSNEDEHFAFQDAYHMDLLSQRFLDQNFGDVPLRDEQRFRKLLLVALRLCQQTSDWQLIGVRDAQRKEVGAENETTRRVHERDAIEIAVRNRPDWRAVEPERYPCFVDHKLFRMKHVHSRPWRPIRMSGR